jgi:hypothetical protein
LNNQFDCSSRLLAWLLETVGSLLLNLPGYSGGHGSPVPTVTTQIGDPIFFLVLSDPEVGFMRDLLKFKLY